VTAVEFANFYAMFIMALLLTRGLQILLKNTWVSPALGALHS
jgi:hypothetical protein